MACKTLSGLCSVETTIGQWYADFKRGRTDTNYAERSGKLNEAVTPENIKQVLKILMDDRKLKVCEIAKMVNISTGKASTILNEKLGMKKVFSKWVPRFLTMEQKQRRVDDSESCLSLFTRNKQDLLRQYVTMDETWIHHFTPESKRQSAESEASENATVTWQSHGVSFLGCARYNLHRLP